MSEESLSTEMTNQHCPYCGAPIHLVVDPADADQEYTEDCEVCCQPMTVITQGESVVEVKREDE